MDLGRVVIRPPVVRAVAPSATGLATVSVSTPSRHSSVSSAAPVPWRAAFVTASRTIRTSCSICGDLELTPVQMALRIYENAVKTQRRAVEQALPGVPHQLCQFHFLREAALPVYEADRHAKKELKKRVRGIRVLERQVEPRSDAEAEVVRGYCAAVRSARS